LLVRIIKSHL